MADEAAVTIVLRMQDEASAKMQDFGSSMGNAQAEATGFQAGLATVDTQLVSVGSTTQATTAQTINLSLAMTAMGTALVGIGSLLNQIDNPTAKMAANFFLISGAILSSASAIKAVIPLVQQLTGVLLAQAAVRSFLAALSGIGIARIIGAVAITGVVIAGIAAATGAFSQPSRQVIEVRTDSPFLDDAALNRVARKVTESQRLDISRGR